MIFPVEKLINAAAAARERAYAPYSGFKVGAAVLTREGRYYTGCNIENASYGLTCCAERVALYKAVSNGERNFEAVAVTAGTDDYCTPCGACRQALAEFGAEIKVYMANRRGEYLLKTVAELLPEAFYKGRLVCSGDKTGEKGSGGKVFTRLIEPVNR
ncbi:MAG TPA: cytidine deaminase [Bacillota bacterium]|nr:cytidine deaminase [Bacillota bacterium]